jgi:hypothetical protein
MENLIKKCSNCKKSKALDLFYNSKYGKYGVTNQCKDCMTAYRNKNKDKNKEYMQNLRKEQNDKVKETRRESYHKNPSRRMYTAAKARAKKYNIPFNIEVEDINIPEKCPLLEIPFIRGEKGNYQYSYSLDRIDNSKGYIKGNIQVISNKANSMKNSASLEELKAFCENMLKIIDSDIV